MRRSATKALSIGPDKRRVSVATILKEVVRQRIDLPHREKVAVYARRHRALAGLLPAVAAQARATFGAKSELSLVLYVDPENAADRHLKLYVRQDAFDADLLDRIDVFREQFHERLRAIEGHLHITTDFRKPGA